VAIFPPVTWTEPGHARGAQASTLVTPLPDGDGGEICVRGANVSPGYLHDGDAGLSRRDGWLCTGDAGRRNPDGTVTFLGVLKPMFTRNGFNIYPREVERVVCELPGVQRAEVAPIPEPTRENDILLRVTGNVRTQDVERWCEQRLSAYKQPSVIELVA
jgi:long-chain acyl-CoA synthetase